MLYIFDAITLGITIVFCRAQILMSILLENVNKLSVSYDYHMYMHNTSQQMWLNVIENLELFNFALKIIVNKSENTQP